MASGAVPKGGIAQEKAALSKGDGAFQKKVMCDTDLPSEHFPD